MSPLFSFEGAAPCALTGGKRTWLIFAGPIHPGDWPGDPATPTWLTLGVYNIVTQPRSASDRDKLLRRLAGLGVGHEIWDVIGGIVQRFRVVKGSSVITDQARCDAIAGCVSEVNATQREYRALVLSTLERAASAGRVDEHAQIRQFDEQFRALVKGNELNDVQKEGLLSIANAALLRANSQTYGGASPILLHECHVWSHSLLGIGIASIAVGRLASFATRSIDNLRLIDRVRALGDVPPRRGKLHDVPVGTGIWTPDFLEQSPIGAPSPRVDMLTYFSGRDGFRGTQLSLSAPRQCITGCNTWAWSLHTITHEIAHIYVEQLLGILLPGSRGDAASLLQVVAGRTPKHLLEQIRAALSVSIWYLHDDKDKQAVEESRFLGGLLDRYDEVNEIMSHVFDFLYFYDEDAESYVDGIWGSWAVIPNIARRIPKYVVRTLCAIFSKHLSRTNGAEVAIDETLLLLEKAELAHPGAQYIPDARRYLTDRRVNLVALLPRYAVIVGFVRYVLHSPERARELSRPLSEELRVLEHSERRQDNPLSFIKKFGKEREPSAQRSAWMLTELALGRYRA